MIIKYRFIYKLSLWGYPIYIFFRRVEKSFKAHRADDKQGLHQVENWRFLNQIGLHDFSTSV